MVIQDNHLTVCLPSPAVLIVIGSTLKCNSENRLTRARAKTWLTYLRAFTRQMNAMASSVGVRALQHGFHIPMSIFDLLR